MQRFGEKLHILRTERGLSVRQLAAVLDLKSPSFISQLEKSQKKPSVDLLLKITLFFDVAADVLIRDDLDLA